MGEIRVELRNFGSPIEFLTKLNKHLENLTPIKGALGDIVRNAIRDYIDKGGTPEEEFAPTFDKYARLEGKGHDKPLWWTGDLYHSIVDKLTRAGVAIGSTLPYAPYVLLADGSTARHYAREEVGGQWIPRGQVIQRGSSFVARKSGFRSYSTVIQKREVLRFFAEDVSELLKWLEWELMGGGRYAYP